MPTNIPYSRLSGVLRIYVAPFPEAVDTLDGAMAANWVELGPTDGAQTLKFIGGMEYFYDNDAIGPQKAVRPIAGFTVTATLVNLLPEEIAMALGEAPADVVDDDAGGVSIRRFPLLRDFAPVEYAMTLRGGAQPVANVDSPFGIFPAQYYVPRGVFDGEPEFVRAKDGSPGLEFTFTALHDATQGAGLELGYFQAQDV